MSPLTRTFSFLFFITLFQLPAANAGCSTIKLNQAAFGPIRDQNGANCYVHVGTDLISYKLGRPISASALEVSYLVSRRRHYLFERDSGYIADLLRQVSSHGGFCLESKMRSHDPKLLPELISKLKRRIPGCEEDVAELFPTVDVRELLAFARQFTDHVNKTAAALMTRGCEPRFQHVPRVAVITRSDLLSFGTIDQQLQKGNPVGISLRMNFLFPPPSTHDGPHAMTVVGRKRDPQSGKCMYQMRNSWGADCDAYNTQIKARCSKGYLWLSQDELTDPVLRRPRFYRIQYLE